MTQYVIRNPNNPIVRDLYKDIPLVDSQGNIVTDSEGRIVCDRYIVQGSVGVSEEVVDTKIKNLSSNFVDTTSTQTVGGNKAFSGAVTVPTVATDNNSNHAASTAFVQNVLSTISGSSVDNLVTKNTAQTITAVKTFNTLPQSSVVPSDNKDLVNKKYVDDSVPTNITGNAATATKLATARDINISDSDGTNTGTKISFDGSGNRTIKLPATIKASITGNCSGSSGSCTGNASTATKATQDSAGNQINTTYAKLASPALTGTPTAPTASKGTNNTQIATTAFVKSQGYLTSHQSLDGCVKTSGNQTVAGIKTFSSVPVCATNPTANNQLANKAYVDSKANTSLSNLSAAGQDILDRKASISLSNLNDTGNIIISRNAMPSRIYDELTLGASGTSYTAPSTGYIYIAKVATASNQYLNIESGGRISFQTASVAGSQTIRCFIPIVKGATFSINYSLEGTTTTFRFVYAIGSVSEKV